VCKRGSGDVTFRLPSHARESPGGRRVAPGGRSSREERQSTRPTWETLEAWVRVKVQEFVQAVLEEEVTEALGRRRYEYGRTYPKAGAILMKDWERMVPFSAFPEGH
jgi:transposase-like protein